jgi:hypothetical protein
MSCSERGNNAAYQQPVAMIRVESRPIGPRYLADRPAFNSYHRYWLLVGCIVTSLTAAHLADVSQNCFETQEPKDPGLAFLQSSLVNGFLQVTLNRLFDQYFQIDNSSSNQ